MYTLKKTPLYTSHQWIQSSFPHRSCNHCPAGHSGPFPTTAVCSAWYGSWIAECVTLLTHRWASGPVHAYMHFILLDWCWHKTSTLTVFDLVFGFLVKKHIADFVLHIYTITSVATRSTNNTIWAKKQNKTEHKKGSWSLVKLTENDYKPLLLFCLCFYCYGIYFLSSIFLMNCSGMIRFIMIHFCAVFAKVTWCLLSSATRRFHSSSVISAPVSVGSPTAAVLSASVET